MAYAERNNRRLTGRWCCDAQYTHADGSTTRWHKAFPSKAEAEGAEAYYRATGSQPPHMAPTSTTSFATVAEKFKERNQDWLNAHDARTNATRLALAVTHFNAVPITSVRKQALEGYIDYLRKHCGHKGKPVANRTVNRYLDAVSKVLHYAHSLDMLPQGIPEFPRLPDTGNTRDAISYELEDRIIAHAERSGKALEAFAMRVLAATGMRSGELQSLKPEQIETPEQIEHTGILLSEEQTKTNAARWVPLVPEAAKKLRVLIAEKRLPDRAHMYWTMKAALEELGESSSLTIHCWRHTTITRLLQSGAQGTDVAAITGHIVPGMPRMQRRYYHPDKAHLFEVAKKVQSRLGEIPQIGEVVAFEQHKKSA